MEDLKNKNTKTHEWTFLKSTAKKGYSLYQHSCGYVDAFQPAAMKRGATRCDACFSEKLSTEAKFQGWKWHFKVDGDYSRYTHIACGEDSTVQHGHMRTGNVSCKNCTVTRWKLEAIAENFTWLEQLSKQYSRYCCNICGVECELATTAVRKGNVKCQNCYTSKLKNEAIQHGWEWLYSTGNGESAYKHSCGSIQKAKHRRIATKSLRCKVCQKTWLVNNSKLYVVRVTTAEMSFIKVGISSSPEDRIINYCVKNKVLIEELFRQDIETGELAHRIENIIHAQLGDVRLDPKLMRSRMKNGFTECYSIENEKVVLEVVESVLRGYQ